MLFITALHMLGGSEPQMCQPVVPAAVSVDFRLSTLAPGQPLHLKSFSGGSFHYCHHIVNLALHCFECHYIQN
jgi:hypothetical protein